MRPTSYARRCSSAKKSVCGRAIGNRKPFGIRLAIGAGYLRDNSAGGTRMVSKKEGRVGNSYGTSMSHGIYDHDGVRFPVMEGTSGVASPRGEGEDSGDALMVTAGGAFSIKDLGRTRMAPRYRRHLRHSKCFHLRSTWSMGMVPTHRQSLNRTRLSLLSHSRVYRLHQPLILWMSCTTVCWGSWSII